VSYEIQLSYNFQLRCKTLNIQINKTKRKGKKKVKPELEETLYIIPPYLCIKHPIASSNLLFTYLSTFFYIPTYIFIGYVTNRKLHIDEVQLGFIHN
jgi:hypothetical protein